MKIAQILGWWLILINKVGKNKEPKIKTYIVRVYEGHESVDTLRLQIDMGVKATDADTAIKRVIHLKGLKPNKNQIVICDKV